MWPGYGSGERATQAIGVRRRIKKVRYKIPQSKKTNKNKVLQGVYLKMRYKMS